MGTSIKKCLNCGIEFTATHGLMKFCSEKCKIHNGKKLMCETITGEEGKDYVICHLCNNKVKRIYGQHLKLFHEGVTSIDYKKMFPGELVACSTDTHNISKNGGKFMKEDKWRKWASDKMKGELNINHRSNTSEQTRKERSPFSTAFYEKRGKSEIDRKTFTDVALASRVLTTTLQYYINKGFSEEESKKLLKDRQITFSLEKCIKKYGEEEGLKRWKMRQEKWLKNYKKQNFSKISQKLFCELHKKIKNDFNHIYFAIIKDGEIDLSGTNHEFNLSLTNRIIKPDFYIEDNKKIIEFDGIYWHKNTPENKKREAIKDKLIIEHGFNILHIREDDYFNHPEEVIEKCINFIYER